MSTSCCSDYKPKRHCLKYQDEPHVDSHLQTPAVALQHGPLNDTAKQTAKYACPTFPICIASVMANVLVWGLALPMPAYV